MASKFEGTFDELQALIKAAGIKGKWEDAGPTQHRFRSSDGGVLSWWPSRGTVSLQGQEKAQSNLEKAISGSATTPSFVAVAPSTASKSQEKQIFIVHGHDSAATDQLELALHRLGLKPFILMNSSGGGMTIIEALEGQIGRDFTSDFGIVLMTPDDFGYSKKEGDKKTEPRPRQNVVLEAGMLLASLTRSRMAIIVKGHLEMPSDLQGVIHLAYNDHVKEIVPKLCQRLKEAGFDLEPKQIAAAAQ
ncbi:MAG TPA: nucleotide-binding protein [Verrucomicrobiae bacterium]|jgi:predicted nucleotide-binding protein